MTKQQCLHDAQPIGTTEAVPTLHASGMLMIGAAGRNAGKTLLACEMIRRFAEQREIVGAKVTAVHEGRGECPRGDDGCGVCSSLEGPYRLTVEKGEALGKDTTRLLEAGANPVYWLCVRHSHLAEGAGQLLDRLSEDTCSVVESNSLRRAVEPDLFLVVRREGKKNVKRSCRLVRHLADEEFSFDGETFDPPLEAIDLVDGRWIVRRKATAIVLAGGKSSRMGRDKALLPYGAKTFIEHIVDQLRPHFDEILISADDVERFAFLGLDVVPDRIPGQGPMMAVTSALRHAAHELSFVVPCDIPRVSIGLLNKLFREARDGADIVVPYTDENHYEPLFAIYRKGVGERLDRALEQGIRRLASVYDSCDTRRVRLGDGDHLTNVNTLSDYEELVNGR